MVWGKVFIAELRKREQPEASGRVQNMNESRQNMASRLLLVRARKGRKLGNRKERKYSKRSRSLSHIQVVNTQEEWQH